MMAAKCSREWKEAHLRRRKNHFPPARKWETRAFGTERAKRKKWDARRRDTLYASCVEENPQRVSVGSLGDGEEMEAKVSGK